MASKRVSEAVPEALYLIRKAQETLSAGERANPASILAAVMKMSQRMGVEPTSGRLSERWPARASSKFPVRTRDTLERMSGAEYNKVAIPAKRNVLSTVVELLGKDAHIKDGGTPTANMLGMKGGHPLLKDFTEGVAEQSKYVAAQGAGAQRWLGSLPANNKRVNELLEFDGVAKKLLQIASDPNRNVQEAVMAKAAASSLGSFIVEKSHKLAMERDPKAREILKREIAQSTETAWRSLQKMKGFYGKGPKADRLTEIQRMLNTFGDSMDPSRIEQRKAKLVAEKEKMVRDFENPRRDLPPLEKRKFVDTYEQRDPGDNRLLRRLRVETSTPEPEGPTGQPAPSPRFEKRNPRDISLVDEVKGNPSLNMADWSKLKQVDVKKGAVAGDPNALLVKRAADGSVEVMPAARRNFNKALYSVAAGFAPKTPSSASDIAPVRGMDRMASDLASVRKALAAAEVDPEGTAEKIRQLRSISGVLREKGRIPEKVAVAMANKGYRMGELEQMAERVGAIGPSVANRLTAAEVGVARRLRGFMDLLRKLR